MVERSGTDDLRAYNLPTRVERLEAGQQVIHEDLAGIKAQQRTDSQLLKDISTKLDETRTRKPNINAMVTTVLGVLGLVGVVGAFAFAPIIREMSATAKFHEAVAEILLDRAEQIGAFAEHQKGMDKRLDSLAGRMLTLEGNQHTKQDAQSQREENREQFSRLWDAILQENEMHRRND